MGRCWTRHVPHAPVYVGDGEEVTNKQLHAAMSELDDRSQDILKSRWLSEDKLTLHELAGKYDVSAERIRQLEKTAMNRIKTCMQT